jgi:hypothetical protein
MVDPTRLSISRRTLIKMAAAAGMAAATFGRMAGLAEPHDLTWDGQDYEFRKYEAIVNRPDAYWRQVFQWPTLTNPIIFANIRNSLNGIQFSYKWQPNQMQVIVQAYASANGATYDDDSWQTYRWGDILGVKDANGQPATRNMWYASKVSAEEVTKAPSDRNHPYYADTSIEGLQRRGVLFLI